MQHLEDDKQMIFELFHLGPLVAVDDVFQNQGVDGEDPTYLFDQGGIVDAVHISRSPLATP